MPCWDSVSLPTHIGVELILFCDLRLSQIRWFGRSLAFGPRLQRFELDRQLGHLPGEVGHHVRLRRPPGWCHGPCRLLVRVALQAPLGGVPPLVADGAGCFAARALSPMMPELLAAAAVQAGGCVRGHWDALPLSHRLPVPHR
jgi:hypothetical protein